VVVSHEQPMHLIAVSRDLAQFQHVHPAPTGVAGEYTVDVTFPTAGSYILYDEFTRRGGQDIVQRDELTVGAPSGAARLTEDRQPKLAGDMRVALQGAGNVQAGREAQLTFRLEDPTTGDGIADLQPYLGAPAHVVILSEDAQSFAHTHGEAVGAGGAHSENGTAGQTVGEMRYGPEIQFHYTFPHPGLYKVWGQFKTHDDQVITADFVVRVN
jgi:P-type Cu+ transporter